MTIGSEIESYAGNIFSMAISGIGKLPGLLIDITTLIWNLLIVAFLVAFEIFFHMFIWAGVVLAFFYLIDFSYEGWDSLMPFTFMYGERNVAFFLVIGFIILTFIVLSFAVARQGFGTTFIFIELFDMLLVYLFIWIALAGKILATLGYPVGRRGYFCLAVIVAGAHMLLVLLVEVHDKLKNVRS